ncbi:hypothetical protein BDZ89DRAFT_959794, partial [Hymenopellis radicata]
SPDIFPDPLAFEPERWMEPASLGLDKYLAKSCLGDEVCIPVPPYLLSSH